MTFVRSRRAVSAALCLALLAAAGCAQNTPEEVDSESVVLVKTAAVERGLIRGVVHATGVVTPAPGADLLVVAPEAARIAAIPPGAGDRVRRGDVLVRFEIPSATADLARQRAEVTGAQAALENAKSAQARSHDLFDRGVAARREVEDADRAEAEAEAALAQANASAAAAQAIADRSTVRAAFDGIVAKRFHNPGDVVEASSGDPVLRVIDPARLEVVASVPLADAPRIQVGAPASLTGTPAAPDAPDAALHVLSRPAAVEPGTATVPVRLGFASPPNLPAGAPVGVDIQAERHENALLVPSAAVVREGEETAVFVANGDKAERRPIEIGLSDGEHAEVVSGLHDGEMVIVDGQAGLPDGAAITTGTTGESREAAPQ